MGSPITISILAADSKFFAGPTLDMAYENNLSFLTLVPKTVGLREELVRQDGDFRLLLTKEGRKKGTFEEYRGYSVIRPYVYENDKGETIERTMRFLVVESTTLEKRKDKKKVLYHSLNFDVKKIEVPIKRGRGRPRNGEEVRTSEGWIIEPSFVTNDEMVEKRRKYQGLSLPRIRSQGNPFHLLCCDIPSV